MSSSIITTKVRRSHLLAQATRAAEQEQNSRTCAYCSVEVEVEWRDTKKGRRPFDAGTSRQHAHRQSPVTVRQATPEERQAFGIK